MILLSFNSLLALHGLSLSENFGKSHQFVNNLPELLHALLPANPESSLDPLQLASLQSDHPPLLQQALVHLVQVLGHRQLRPIVPSPTSSILQFHLLQILPHLVIPRVSHPQQHRSLLHSHGSTHHHQ